MKRINNHKGQQEMVGFVLIVVVVVVGLMVFLIWSIKDSGEVENNLRVENMLDVIMRSTTGCAIVYEPNYDDFEDLIKDYYENKYCKNIGMSVEDYLNESLNEVLSDIFASEATTNAYTLTISSRGDGEMKGLMMFSEGNCSGSISGAQRRIDAGTEDLIVRLNIC